MRRLAAVLLLLSCLAAPSVAAAQPSRAALKRSLGPEGVLKVDPQTGTPRVIAKLDGFLSA
ncbi:MAG: hypothetical protein QOI80_2846, partial [Solirubrobacteraceae bacterium]|nr:hypothetical protein [Solirubrobacteraceae bacterium]